MKMATILLIAAAAVLLPTPSSAACKDDLTVCKDINFYGYKGDGCDLKEEVRTRWPLLLLCVFALPFLF